MRLSKVCTLTTFNRGHQDDYASDADGDLHTLFLALSGRLRFGDGTTATNGENISGQFVDVTTSATPDAENTIAHTVGSVPVGYLVLHQDKAGTLYQGPTTGTSWTSTALYLKCNVASVTYKLFLLR